jgi:hypothetical protein
MHRILLMERVKIVSDFLDYYDHHFDGSSAEITFSRMSRSGVNHPGLKSEAYRLVD